MTDLDLADGHLIAVAVLAALAGGFVRGFTGFGGPAVMILILVQVFEPLSVLTKVMLIDLIANVSLLGSTRGEVNWRVTGLMLLGSLVALPLGVALLESGDPAVIKRFIAGVVGVCAIAMLTGWRYRRTPSAWVTVGIGLMAGIALGATFIALVAMVFFFANPSSANISRANAVYWGFFTVVPLLVYHFSVGNIVLSDVWRVALVGLVYLGATMCGARAFRASGERLFRRAVLWLLLLLAGIGILA